MCPDQSTPSAHNGRHELVLYVAPFCPTCPSARELLGRVHAEFPGLETKLVDLGVSLEEKPDMVFAVPTFMLDGAVVSLGTPTWDRITQVLTQAGVEDRPR